MNTIIVTNIITKNHRITDSNQLLSYYHQRYNIIITNIIVLIVGQYIAPETLALASNELSGQVSRRHFEVKQQALVSFKPSCYMSLDSNVKYYQSELVVLNH